MPWPTTRWWSRSDGHDVEKRGTAWYVVNRSTGTRRSGLADQLDPRDRRIKLLAIGNRAEFDLTASVQPPRTPSYIRLGKWMSKARLAVEEVSYEIIHEEGVTVAMLLNPLDLAKQTRTQTFDLVSIHPVPRYRATLY